MTTALEHSKTETSERTTADVCATLSELGERCQSKSKFYREALQAVAEHFASPYTAMQISQAASTLDERLHSGADGIEMWKLAVDEALLDSQVENVQIARLYGVEGSALQAAVLAVPVCEQTNHPIGAMSVVVSCDSTPLAGIYLREFAALVSLITARAQLIALSETSTAQDDTPLKRAIVKATDFRSLHELAFAVTNSLKNKYACERVILGQVENEKIKILSISGMDNLYPKSPGVKQICQAMEECMDLGSVICCQDEDKWSEESVATNHCLHRHWHAEIGNTPVASVPLLVGDKCVAVLSVNRSKQLPFSESELTKIREAITPFAPAMVLVGKADRSLLRHATDTLRKGISWLLAPHTHQRKAILGAILVGFAYFCFATIGYTVTVPSQITPTEIRSFASPFKGTIKACYVKVGDSVAQGELLYEMDTTEFLLQRKKLESDLAVLRLRVNQALASEDIRSAALAGAEIKVVQAQLSMALHNLAEAQVRAPSRGSIVAGELSKRIGEVVPMGASLLEFVPKGDWSIELRVPERVATSLEVGFEGRFACNARPGESLDCKIVRIRPSSEPRDGKNVFIAEAAVKGNPHWMRAGMEGIAQIDAGERRLWWVTLHRVIDYVQLTFWL